MARRLCQAVSGVEGVTVTRAPAANAVFAVLPATARERLQQDFDFYEWDDATGEVRWMCSWDTTEADIDEFARAVGAAVAIP
jgi:threonine aldolase